ncbi:MAG: MaoC family dehydratase [Sphingomonadales bacterium]
MDLSEFEKQVGIEFYVSDWLGISQERIDAFAEATLDFQWIHQDPERCKTDSPWETTIAHGFLTLSLVPFFINQFTDTLNLARKINYGLEKVRFPEAVRVEDKIRGRFKLLEAKTLKGKGLKVVVEATIEIEGRDKPGCVAQSVLLMVGN